MMRGIVIATEDGYGWDLPLLPVPTSSPTETPTTMRVVDYVTSAVVIVIAVVAVTVLILAIALVARKKCRQFADSQLTDLEIWDTLFLSTLPMYSTVEHTA